MRFPDNFTRWNHQNEAFCVSAPRFIQFSESAWGSGSNLITESENFEFKKCLEISFALFVRNTFSLNIPCIIVGVNEHEEQHEIQRQNRITEQILTNFFERKFFPNRKPKPAPTIDEILPPESRANPSIRDKHSAQRENDDDEPETDNLQSVESEHVDSFYEDYPEGRWKFLKVILHIFVMRGWWLLSFLPSPSFVYLHHHRFISRKKRFTFQTWEKLLFLIKYCATFSLLYVTSRRNWSKWQ